MAFYVYILLCADSKYYISHTDNIERRMDQHQNGLIEGFDLSRMPVKLMWALVYPTCDGALDAEMKLKGWSQAKIETLIGRDPDRLSFFYKPPKNGGSQNSGENGVHASVPFVSSVAKKSFRRRPKLKK
jgi:putative endonuclease